MNLLNLESLPSMSAQQVAHANRACALSRRVYALAGGQFCLSQTLTLEEHLAVQVRFAGQVFPLTLSRALVDRHFRDQGTSVADLDATWLLWMLQAQTLAPAVQIESLIDTFVPSTVFTLVGLDGTPTPYQVGADDEAILKAIEPYFVGLKPSPLETLPIPMPLIASAIEVDAEQLAQLEVGDLLIVG